MLGRVMAFYAMGALGSPPLGALLLATSRTDRGDQCLHMSGAVCLIAAGISLMSLRRRGMMNLTSSIRRRNHEGRRRAGRRQIRPQPGRCALFDMPRPRDT